MFKYFIIFSYFFSLDIKRNKKFKLIYIFTKNKFQFQIKLFEMEIKSQKEDSNQNTTGAETNLLKK